MEGAGKLWSEIQMTLRGALSAEGRVKVPLLRVKHNWTGLTFRCSILRVKGKIYNYQHQTKQLMTLFCRSSIIKRGSRSTRLQVEWEYKSRQIWGEEQFRSVHKVLIARELLKNTRKYSLKGLKRSMSTDTVTWALCRALKPFPVLWTGWSKKNYRRYPVHDSANVRSDN